MAIVRIRNENVSFEVPDGAELLPYLKEKTNMLFGCERGECGVCICAVSRGRDNVEPRTQREELTLAKMAAYPTQRLACQIKIKKGEVELEY